MPPQAKPRDSRLKRVTLAIHAALNDPTVKHGWGAFALKNHAQPRRIVWVRTQSTIEPPKQAGGRLQGIPAGASTEQGASRARLCRIRVQVVDAHIYGEDEGAVDDTLDNLLAAVELVWPQTEYIFEDWPLENETDANITHYPKAIVRMRLRLAVADEVLPLQVVAGEAHECGILQEDGSLNSS